MARIQDIRQFEELICECVDEYLQEMDCYENPVLAIWRERQDGYGEHRVVIDEPSNIPLNEDMEQYPIDELIRRNDDDSLEPEIDRINEIANSWIFLDH